MVHGSPFWLASCSPGGRLPLTTVMRKVGLLGAVAYSPAAKDMPTLPGPISQTPLLQAKCVVSRVGAVGDGGGDGVGDGGGVGDSDGFGCAAAGAAVVSRAAGRVAPRIAANDPVISSALSGERMTTSPGRRKR